MRANREFRTLVWAAALFAALTATAPAWAAGAGCGDGFGELGERRSGISRRTKLVAIGGTLLAGIGAGLAWGLQTHDHPGKVTGTSWDHSIDVQSFQVVTREHWCSGLSPSSPVMPVNGQGEAPGLWNIQHRGTKFSHYNQIYYGNDSNGRPQYIQQPVYEDWCSYETYDWVTVRTERTNGLDPKPGEGPLPIPTVTLGQYERQLPLKRTYAVEIRYERDGKERIHVASPADEETFRAWTPGSGMVVTRNNFGMIRRVRKE